MLSVDNRYISPADGNGLGAQPLMGVTQDVEINNGIPDAPFGIESHITPPFNAPKANQDVPSEGDDLRNSFASSGEGLRSRSDSLPNLRRQPVSSRGCIKNERPSTRTAQNNQQESQEAEKSESDKHRLKAREPKHGQFRTMPRAVIDSDPTARAADSLRLDRGHQLSPKIGTDANVAHSSAQSKRVSSERTLAGHEPSKTMTGDLPCAPAEATETQSKPTRDGKKTMEPAGKGEIDLLVSIHIGDTSTGMLRGPTLSPQPYTPCSRLLLVMLTTLWE